MGVRVKMVIDDQVSEQLRKLGTIAPDVLERVLSVASLVAKERVKGGMHRVLETRTGKMAKQVHFKKTSKGRYKLSGPKLGSIYEYIGADIFPKTAKTLKWRDKLGNWQSSDFVHIDARPFFYPAIRQFVESGEFDRVLETRLSIEIDRGDLKL